MNLQEAQAELTKLSRFIGGRKPPSKVGDRTGQAIGVVLEEVERLQKQHEQALAKVDGVDYRIGHFRDNTTPDGLRDIILGLALRLTDLRAIVAAYDAYFQFREPSTAAEQQEYEDLRDKCYELRKAAKAGGE